MFGTDFKFGDQLKTSPKLAKFALKVGEKKAVVFLDSDTRFGYATHFLSGIGFFHCLASFDANWNMIEEGACCKALDKLSKAQEAKGVPDKVHSFPSVKASMPVATFSVDKAGNIDLNSLEFCRFEFTRTVYANLTKAVETAVSYGQEIDFASLHKYAIIVSGVEPVKVTKFNKVELSFIIKQNGLSPFTSNQDLQQQASDYITEFNTVIKDVVGKTVDAEHILKSIQNYEAELTEADKVETNLNSFERPEAKTDLEDELANQFEDEAPVAPPKATAPKAPAKVAPQQPVVEEVLSLEDEALLAENPLAGLEALADEEFDFFTDEE